jgi:hypothetical protein
VVTLRQAQGIDFDRTRYPFIVMRARGDYSAEDWARLLEQKSQAVLEGPFVLLNDTRGGRMPTPIERKGIAEFYARHQLHVRKNFLATAVVGSSRIVAGIVTALIWLAGPAHPYRMFTDPAAAERWLQEYFSPEMRAEAERRAPS